MSKDKEENLSGMQKLIKELKELVVTVAIFLPIWFVFMLVAYELRSIPSESMVPTLQVGDRVAVSKFAYGYSRHSVPFGIGKFLPLGDGRLFASQPERGDVIVFKHPHDDKTMIKRLIGLPGDEIEVRNNTIFLNGEAVRQEPVRHVSYRDYKGGYLRLADEYMETLPNGKSYLVHDIEPNPNSATFIVPDGHYFFMGDNRDNSADSRKLSGHCPPNDAGIIDSADCEINVPEATIGFVPYDNLIGRAETVFFTLNFCNRYEEGCPKGRVWKSL